MQPGILRFAALLVLCMIVAGCQPARMALPDELAPVEPWVVTGRQGWKLNEHYRFGPWEAREVDRSWVRGGDWNVAFWTMNKRRQHYAFVLAEDSADRFRVRCRARLKDQRIELRDLEVMLEERSRLECDVTPFDAPGENWHLAMHENGARPLEGEIRSPATRLKIVGSRELSGGLPLDATAGYRFLDGARSVGAVEVINEGRVWLLSPVTDHQHELAGISAAALLLMEELRALIEEGR